MLRDFDSAAFVINDPSLGVISPANKKQAQVNVARYFISKCCFIEMIRDHADAEREFADLADRDGVSALLSSGDAIAVAAFTSCILRLGTWLIRRQAYIQLLYDIIEFFRQKKSRTVIDECLFFEARRVLLSANVATNLSELLDILQALTSQPSSERYPDSGWRWINAMNILAELLGSIVHSGDARLPTSTDGVPLHAILADLAQTLCENPPEHTPRLRVVWAELLIVHYQAHISLMIQDQPSAISKSNQARLLASELSLFETAPVAVDVIISLVYSLACSLELSSRQLTGSPSKQHVDAFMLQSRSIVHRMACRHLANSIVWNALFSIQEDWVEVHASTPGDKILPVLLTAILTSCGQRLTTTEPSDADALKACFETIAAKAIQLVNISDTRLERVQAVRLALSCLTKWTHEGADYDLALTRLTPLIGMTAPYLTDALKQNTEETGVWRVGLAHSKRDTSSARNWPVGHLITGKWKSMPNSRAKRFLLEAMAFLPRPPNFGGAGKRLKGDVRLSELNFLDLPFYLGWSLCEIAVLGPYGQCAVLDVLANFEDGSLLVLNGESYWIHVFNRLMRLQLKDQTLAYEYMRFFCATLRSAGSRFVTNRDLKELPAEFYSEISKLEHEDEGRAKPINGADAYVTSTLVFHNNVLFASRLTIHASGEIEMNEDDVLAEIPGVPKEIFDGPWRLSTPAQ